jgi:hypothetical protein
LYTLVHHEYNDGKALIFRDTSYSTSKYRSSASYEGYNNSVLDNYLTGTFYASLPSTTTQFLQDLNYPIKDSTHSYATDIIINRTAATISGLESGLGGTTGYGNVLDYTNTIDIKESYWTREPVGGMDRYALAIGTDGILSNRSITTSYGVRPTLGVLEDQLVIYSESEGGYLFCSKCLAPDTIFINGALTDVVDLNSEANMILSWSNGTDGYNAPISGYAIWYSTSINGQYELYGTTTGNSMTIVGPKKGHQTYYFKVQTLGPEEADYCNSELSSDCRSVATKKSSIYYFDGSTWKIAMPKRYDGTVWNNVEGTKHYNGSQWVKLT